MSTVPLSQHQRARILRGIAKQLEADPKYYTPEITNAVVQLCDAMLHRSAQLQGKLPEAAPRPPAQPRQPT